jgi:hypothetical protein
VVGSQPFENFQQVIEQGLVDKAASSKQARAS